MKDTTIMKNKKGQVIIVALLMFFVALVIVSTLLGPVVEFSEYGINQTANSTHATLIASLLRYIPVFIVLVLITSLFLIISAR